MVGQRLAGCMDHAAMSRIRKHPGRTLVRTVETIRDGRRIRVSTETSETSHSSVEARHTQIALCLQGQLCCLEQGSWLFVGQEEANLAVADPGFERGNQFLVNGVSGWYIDTAAGGLKAVSIRCEASELLLSQPMQFVASGFGRSARREVILQRGFELIPGGDGGSIQELSGLRVHSRSLHVLFPRDPPAQCLISQKLLRECDLSRLRHMRIAVLEEDIELVDPVDHSVAVLPMEHTGFAEQSVESEVGVVALRTCGLR